MEPRKNEEYKKLNPKKNEEYEKIRLNELWEEYISVLLYISKLYKSKL